MLVEPFKYRVQSYPFHSVARMLKPEDFHDPHQNSLYRIPLILPSLSP